MQLSRLKGGIDSRFGPGRNKTLVRCRFAKRGVVGRAIAQQAVGGSPW